MFTRAVKTIIINLMTVKSENNQTNKQKTLHPSKKYLLSLSSLEMESFPLLLACDSNMVWTVGSKNTCTF